MIGLAPSRRKIGVADLVRVALGGLRTRRLRSGLSALGIAIGVASMVAVLALSDSSRADLLAALDELGTNLLTAEPGQSIFGEDSTLPATAIPMVNRIAGVEQASAVTNVSARVLRTDYIPRSDSNGLRVRAVDTDLLSTLGGTMREGRFLDTATERYPAVVLGSVAAERLGISRLSGRVRIQIGTGWFTVVGVMESLPLSPDLDRAVLIGHPVAEARLDASSDATRIYVRALPDAVTRVRSVLASTANPEHPEEVNVARPSDAIEAKAAAKAAFRTLFLGLGAIALLVGGVGIANVMVISVIERRSEIGLRRALGATRRHIRTQFLAESLVLAGAGGALGVALGVGATAIFAAARGWALLVPPVAVAGGVGASLAMGALAGLYPAVRAARLAPTEALRSA
jgi:putative ABC transport system permease protein